MSRAPIRIIDTHCHLGHTEEAPAAVILRATAAGVTKLIDVGIDARTTLAARERANEHGMVYFTAGLHPCDADRLDDDWDAIAEAAEDVRCVAVGESGFDFHWDRTTPAAQRRAFERHLELAIAIDKPLVVHCRDAFDATFEVIAAHPAARCVMHCFAGGIDEARKALDLDCFLSFAAPLTYPRSGALRDTARFAPWSHIVVETDAPFLPPQSRRGQHNEPAWITETLGALAELRGVTTAEVAAATSSNADRVFGL